VAPYENGKHWRWNLLTDTELPSSIPHSEGWSILSPEGDLLLLQHAAGIDLIDTKTGDRVGLEVSALRQATQTIGSAPRFSGDGTRVIASGADGTLLLFDVSNGEFLTESSTFTYPSLANDYTNEPVELQPVYRDGKPFLFDWETGGILGPLDCEIQGGSLSFSRDRAWHFTWRESDADDGTIEYKEILEQCTAEKQSTKLETTRCVWRRDAPPLSVALSNSCARNAITHFSSFRL
jgi:WD40 repeat protein